MKQVFGYLLLLGLIFICWWAAFVFYTGGPGDRPGVYIAGGFGMLFTALLVYAITYEARKVRRKAFVDEDYDLIMTDLDHIEALGENLYYVHTKWIDPDGGAIYYFKSEYIEFNPESFLVGKDIPVKISRRNYKLYTVDLSILPKLA